MKILSIKQFVAIVAVLIITTAGAMADDFSFTVKNLTGTRITKILVSQDGKTYGQFDIGRGIQPGKTVTLVWDESTNDESCKQWVKAVYADGSEAEPAQFDFCEEGLEIEFSE